MIPAKLTIEGLYSYQERQTIDFTNLTDSGLFGIFGATGSGKSSILEAISYALYAETERMHKRDNRRYNMMNLKSNRAYIEFDFYNHENKKFRVTREFKRNSKRFNDVPTGNSNLYEWKNNKWIPQNLKDVEEIIGLSYDNFKRTIIIPQGQFKEFLELGAKDRTDMMKEIFQLHRYDLQGKTSRLRKESQSKLDNLGGQLKGFEEISKKEITSRKKDLSEAEEKLEAIQQKHQALDEKYQHLKSLKADFDSLKTKEEKLDQLEKKQPEIQSAREDLELYERISRVFRQLLKVLEKNESDIRVKKKRRNKIERQLKALKSKKQEKEKELKKITPEFEKLPQKRKEEQDLGFIIKILEADREIKRIKKKGKEKKENLKIVRKEEQNIQSKIEEAEKELKELKTKKPDSKVLHEVGSWYQKQQNLKDGLQTQTKKVSDKKEEIQHLEAALKDKNINIDHYEANFETKLNKFNLERKTLEEKRSQIEVQQKLAKYTRELHDGKPCPLCGSPDHPDIAEVHDLSDDMKEISEKIDDNESEKNSLRENRSKAKRIIDKKDDKYEELKSEQKEVSGMKAQIEDHLEAFVWKDFNPERPEEFQKKRKRLIQLEEEIEKKNDLLAELRESSGEIRDEVEQAKEELNLLKSEMNAKQAEKESNSSNIAHLKFEDFKDQPVDEIKDQSDELRAKNDEVKETHGTLKKELEKLTPKVAAHREKLSGAKEQIQELEMETADLETEVDEKVEEEPVDTIQEVQKILARDIDVSKERKRIKDFEIQFETLKNSIKELEFKLGRESFTENSFQKTEEEWKRSGKEKEETNNKVVKLTAKIEELQKKYEEKQSLEKKYKKVEKRVENLQELFKLFKASGFVQYVSSIYLRRLCDRANVRFQQMTHNQLSLQVNEKNDFEIIDYLNEGRSRSVKTLSGGQSFQVSLSLALALAESIQSHAKSEKNFFFIDEGFGTQDMESIDIIFETLLKLNKEDKVVGVISHVEALQDRIPISVTIEKDPERGSLISEG
jgi:exonuclease SbcC